VVVDTSAILAILRNEPECARFIHLMEDASTVLVSAATVLEAAMVLEGRFGPDAGSDLDLFLAEAGAVVVPFDASQLKAARSAFRRYGKGRHPAGLNFGDCISYGLSRCLAEPLLFKGDDFAATDVVAATAGVS